MRFSNLGGVALLVSLMGCSSEKQTANPPGNQVEPDSAETIVRSVVSSLLQLESSDIPMDRPISELPMYARKTELFEIVRQLEQRRGIVISDAVIAQYNGGKPERGSIRITPNQLISIVRQAPQLQYDLTNELTDRYRFVSRTSLQKGEIEAAKKVIPYTEIQFERTECYGSCPAFIVTLRLDGTAKYAGRKFVEKMGEHVGEIDLRSYGRLCWAIEKFKLSNLQREYTANWTDDTTAILRVKGRNSEPVVEISDYGSQGPIELWMIQNVIDGLVSQIKWSVATQSEAKRIPPN